MNQLHKIGVWSLGFLVAVGIALALTMHWVCLFGGQFLRTSGTLLLNASFFLHAWALRVGEGFDRRFYS